MRWKRFVLAISLFFLMNKYEKAYIDGSFLITRNLWVVTKGKKIEDMNPGDVLKVSIQTINKLSKTWGIGADKVCLIFDEWDKSLGGYIRSWLIKDHVAYKGSRKFVTEQDLEDMKKDPKVNEKEIKKAERELAIGKIKFEAKRLMKEEFKKIGIPYFSWPGYEFDDIVTLASINGYGKRTKPDVIVTKDSDLTWSLMPGVDFFRLPTNGSKPEVITYQDMIVKVPQELRDKGVSLYWYHAYCDSLGITGHNDNLKTIKRGRDGTKTILNILDGCYDDVKNVEAFLAQMKSFDLPSFPEVDKVNRMIEEDFNTAGHLGTVREFNEVCKCTGIEGIRDEYYSDFIGRLDQKLYCE